MRTFSRAMERELFIDIKNLDTEYPFKSYIGIEPLLRCQTGVETLKYPIEEIRTLEVYWVVPPIERTIR